MLITSENLLTAGKQQNSYISAKGERWQLADCDERQSITIQQKLLLPEILARILTCKELTLEQIPSFLQPTIKDLLPDPLHLLDMEKAATLVTEMIKAKKKIVVFGDYDVDGATSSALLKRYFAAIGVEIEIYIPDRILEGYGPNEDAFRSLKAQGAELIITVDCGTSAFAAIELANQLSMQVIILDHHLSTDTLPAAFAVINPNRLDETSEYKYLAAVGVSFLFAVAVQKLLRQQGYFEHYLEPNLMALMDLVALGTICDVVPLIGINRAFVRSGLKILAQRQNQGLAALADISMITQEIDAKHLGFALGPRINAGGRVGTSGLGASLLSSDDYEDAYLIAAQLDRFNKERKALESLVLEEAMQMATACDNLPMVFIAGENWHPGVIGIIASRVKDKFQKPAIIMSISAGIAKASCRSVTGIDLGSAIVSARALGLVTEGGGHSMAAGFTTSVDRLAELQDFLCQRFASPLAFLQENRLSHFIAYIDFKTVNTSFASLIKQLEPFGPANPEPRFMLKNCKVVKSTIVGQNHLSCIIADSNVIGGLSGTIKCFVANAVGTKLGDLLNNSYNLPLNLICTISINHWQGKTRTELNIIDATN